MRISSVCCKLLESEAWPFLVVFGLAKGIDVSIGVGELDFNALAYFCLKKISKTNNKQTISINLNQTLGVLLSVFLVTNAGLSYRTRDDVGAIILIF